MKRVAWGIVLLWATAGRAADSVTGEFDVGGLLPDSPGASPALDAINITPPAASTFLEPAGVLEPAGGATALIEGASTNGTVHSLRVLLDSSLDERTSPAARLNRIRQPDQELGGDLYAAPAPRDPDFNTAGPRESASQALHLGAKPPEFAGAGSSGPKLTALVPWAGAALAGLLIVWAVIAAGILPAA